MAKYQEIVKRTRSRRRKWRERRRSARRKNRWPQMTQMNADRRHLSDLRSSVFVCRRSMSSATAPSGFAKSPTQPASPFVLENSPTERKHLIETMPGGIAVFDYDGDGRPDIYFTNGADIPSLEKSSPKYWNRLYRNEGEMEVPRRHRGGGRRRRRLLHGRGRGRLRQRRTCRPLRRRRQSQHPLPQSRQRHGSKT